MTNETNTTSIKINKERRKALYECEIPKKVEGGQ
jgi:hypothetical protein